MPSHPANQPGGYYGEPLEEEAAEAQTGPQTSNNLIKKPKLEPKADPFLALMQSTMSTFKDIAGLETKKMEAQQKQTETDAVFAEAKKLDAVARNREAELRASELELRAAEVESQRRIRETELEGQRHMYDRMHEMMFALIAHVKKP